MVRKIGGERMTYVAVLANVNGNLPALTAALERIEKLKEEGHTIEKYYILGNLVGLFPYPTEVIKVLESLMEEKKVSLIRGEFDQAIAESDPHGEGLDYIKKLNYPDFIKKALQYSWERLGHEGREFVRDVPVYLVDRIGKNDIFGVYGSPFDPFGGVVLPDQPTSYYNSIMRAVKDYEMLFVASPRYPVNAMTRYGRVVCPGSIGYPPDKGHRPTFALVDTDTLHVRFFEVDYDKGVVEDRIRREGLPEELIRILYRGRV